RQAYVNNSRSTLEDNSTKDGYRELIGVMKKFDKVELSFTSTWVEIKDSSVYLSVSWKGVWTVGSKSREERGLGIFVLEGNPLKLATVQRDNPFRQPE
ncbi:MAG: lipoprotein, partial [Nitrospirae bacterium]|nr:lipoprotein [Nitrospirota bacterium]